MRVLSGIPADDDLSLSLARLKCPQLVIDKIDDKISYQRRSAMREIISHLSCLIR